uniref:Uncharacterized protein LOC105852643 n=1 Tax=Cicer arietinum TaxID=3827 RepID=A0A1S3EG00_CICAR|nr:uncharacterized protein LOC105852643 [Cicer arietinum]
MDKFDVNCLEHDSEKRLQIWEYPVNQIDEIRRAYLNWSSLYFQGHDESLGSKNRGNFLEMVKLVASYNDELAKVVIENAPYNSKYTSPKIQKEILHIISSKVKSYIREEIGDSKFRIIVDELRDESLREQMAIILSMKNLYNPTCAALQNVRRNGTSYSTCGNANVAYKVIKSFEFILILHMMKEIMKITDNLCQALQHKSQDILNAMQLINNTKALIQKLRDGGSDDLLKNELNHILCAQTMELLSLSNSLVPNDIYRAFNMDNISTTERSFSAMKIIKTRLCSKIYDEFLADNMILYIEKEIAKTFNSDSIIDDFKTLGE